MKNFPAHAHMERNGLKKILEEILKMGVCSKREVQYATGLSWGNISQKINLLLEKGILVEYKEPFSEQDTKSIGRKSSKFVFCENNFFSIGMSIKPNEIVSSIVSITEKPICLRNVKLKNTVTEKNFFEVIVNTFRETISHIGIEEKNVIAFHLSLTGAVDVNNFIWKKTPKITWVNDFDLSPLRFYFPEVRYFSIEHDVNALAKAVLKENKWKTSNYACLYISDGIGLVMSQEDGNFFSGSRGFAGEIGHIPWNREWQLMLAERLFRNQKSKKLFLQDIFRDTSINARQIRKITETQNNIALEDMLSTRGINKYCFNKHEYASFNQSFDKKATQRIYSYVLPLLIFTSIVVCNMYDPHTLIIGGEAIQPVKNLLEKEFPDILKQNTWLNSPDNIEFFSFSGNISDAYGVTLNKQSNIIDYLVRDILK